MRKEYWPTPLQVHIEEKRLSDLTERKQTVDSSFTDIYCMTRSHNFTQIEPGQNCSTNLNAISSMLENGGIFDKELDQLENNNCMMMCYHCAPLQWINQNCGTRLDTISSMKMKGAIIDMELNLLEHSNRMIRSTHCAPLEHCENVGALSDAMANMQNMQNMIASLDRELDVLEQTFSVAVPEDDEGSRNHKPIEFHRERHSNTIFLVRLTIFNDLTTQTSVTIGLSKVLEKMIFVDMVLEGLERSMTTLEVSGIESDSNTPMVNEGVKSVRLLLSLVELFKRFLSSAKRPSEPSILVLFMLLNNRLIIIISANQIAVHFFLIHPYFAK